jgi:hypothetical protein
MEDSIMKGKRTIIAMLIMVFVLSFAAAFMTADKAMAARPDIPTIIYCSRDTGPNCTNPNYPYYLYVRDRSGTHFVGCCNGLFD